MIEVMFSSATDDWATPRAFFDELDREFVFTLDAAASHGNAKCPTYLTRDDNALIHLERLPGGESRRRRRLDGGEGRRLTPFVCDHVATW